MFIDLGTIIAVSFSQSMKIRVLPVSFVFRQFHFRIAKKFSKMPTKPNQSECFAPSAHDKICFSLIDDILKKYHIPKNNQKWSSYITSRTSWLDLDSLTTLKLKKGQSAYSELPLVYYVENIAYLPSSKAWFSNNLMYVAPALSRTFLILLY